MNFPFCVKMHAAIFETPAQSSHDPNPVLSSAAEAAGAGAGRSGKDASMPDASGDVSGAKTSAPTKTASSAMPPPTYVPPSAKVKAQQRAVARAAPLSEPTMDPASSAFAPLSPVTEIPPQRSSARLNVPAAGPMPQTLKEAGDDAARRRPFIHASAYAIPIRLPAFVVPGVIHPNHEDSMVAASVAPPTPEQRKHSAYHFGAMANVLIQMLTVDMFQDDPVDGSGKLEKSHFGEHLAFIRAREEMINDRVTARVIGDQTLLTYRVTPSISQRIPDINVSAIDYDNAFRTLTYTLCRLRSEIYDGPFHAEFFKNPGSTIIPIDAVIRNMERARQMDVNSGRGKKNFVPFFNPGDPSAYDRTAAVLLMIAKRDVPKRFEFFCVSVQNHQGEDEFQLAGVRMVLDYGFVCRFPTMDKFQECTMLLIDDYSSGQEAIAQFPTMDLACRPDEGI